MAKKSSGIKSFISFVITVVAMILLDGFWNGVVMNDFYTKNLPSYAMPFPNFIPLVIIYILIVAGIRKFVLPISKKPGEAVINGIWLGITIYGTYDLANYAFLTGWSLAVVAADLAWGVVLFGVITLLAFFLKEKILKA